MENEAAGVAGWSLQVFAAVFVAGCVVLFGYIVKAFMGDEEKHGDDQTKNDIVVPQVEKRKEQSQATRGKKKSSENTRWGARSDKQTFSHPWLLTTLKGHTGQVLDMEYSSNGKYLASCAEDRSVMLWDARDLAQKNHKSVRVNVDYDHATLVRWSPDVTAFIVSTFSGNTCEVYKVEKKKDGTVSSSGKTCTFPKVHDDDIIGLGIESHGRFIMTCSNKTDLVLSDLKGNQLAKLDTYLMNTVCAKISPCGRFIVATGFAPDVKVWEVCFTRTGEFQDVKRVFELTGHSSGVHDVAFDQDSSHMATISKDGTWKVFRTNVDYKKGESPNLRITGSYEQTGASAKIALSPNAEVVAIASSNSVAFYSTEDGKLDHTIEDIYSGNVTSLMFDSLGKYLLTSGDKQIRVFHNVAGHRAGIVSAKEKLRRQQTSATKERLLKQIAASEAFLGTIEL